MRTCEFADGFRISAARFAGRTESSAPTAFEKFSRFCVGVDAHIDPMAIADSHWIFVKTAHTAGAMCSIAPYEHPGRICRHSGRIPRRNFPNKKDTPVPCIGTRVPEYFVVPPKFEELALPRMPRFRGGDRRFRDFPYTPARRMSFAHAGRRNLSACDFLSVRPPCGTASASLRFCIIQMNALSGASWP